MSLYALIVLALQLILGGIIFSLGLFVLWKNPRREANLHFWIFTLGTAGANFCFFIAISTIGQPLFWGRLAISFGTLIASGLFLFTSTFPRIDKYTRVLRIPIYLAALFIFFLALTPAIVKEAEAVDYLYLKGEFGRFYYAFWIFYVGLFIVSPVKLFIKSRHAKGLERMQLRFVATGFIIFFVPFFITQFILPFFGRFEYNNLGPLFSAPMAFLIGYAIVRHRLFDIRIVIQRSLIYIILLALIIAFYILAVFSTEYVFMLTQGSPQFVYRIGAIITTAVGIFGVPFVERFFRKATDRFFFKDNYDYATALEELSQILNKNLDMHIITEETTKKLEQIFKAEKVEIITARNALPPEIRHAIDKKRENIFPITTDDKTLGVLIMGEKRSEDAYTKKDIQLITTFVHQAAIALEKAALYARTKAFSEQLEKRVRERTKEIEMLRKEEAQTMVDIAHNLLTPLTVVKGELAHIKTSAKEMKKIRAFEQSIDSISHFIYNLLDLAKLETQQRVFAVKPVDISAILQELVEYFSVLAEKDQIEIISRIEPNIVVMANKNRINELLVNLVSNSFKYMDPHREKKITITLSKKDTKAKIVIEDTGVGISLEELPHIFQRFYRVKSDNSAEIRGVGLGLAICKKIVEKHKGAISAVSEQGKGTIFTILFPIAKRLESV